MARLTVDLPAPEVLRIEHPGQVLQAQALARTFCRGLGFPDLHGEEIALAVHELASNLVKHAGGGTLSLSAIRSEQRSGIQVESADRGPGIPDPEHALVDGVSTAGSLGIGLGTVHRLMDDLEFSAPESGGARVVCRRWLRGQRDPHLGRMLDLGVATRPRRNERQNGDAFVIRCWEGHALAGVLDGLGHGEPAQSAAQRARAYLEEHPDLPLERLFLEVDRTCRSSRGVVMALASFDLATESFQFGSIGNIEPRLLERGGRSCRPCFVLRRGVLGLNAPKPVVTTHSWKAGSILVLHTDGVRTHWSPEDLPGSVWATSGGAARSLLDRFAREEDDATVLVVRSLADEP